MDNIFKIQPRDRESVYSGSRVTTKTTGSGGGGDGMDLEHRVYTTERDVAEMKADIASIKATMPHLATKAWVTGASGLLGLVVVAMGLLSMFVR